MTLYLTRGTSERLTLRYFPAIAWLFVAFTAYGIVSIVLAVRAGSQPFSLATVVAVTVLFGLALFVAATAGQFVVCSFDRPRDQVRISRFGLRGRLVQERPLSSITGLDVQLLRRSQHRLVLQFASGEQLPLTPYYVIALNMGGIERLSALLGVRPNMVTTLPGNRLL